MHNDRPLTPKTMKIGLLDHMGYGNLGDAATQEALIANIKKRLPHAAIVGFSLNPNDTMMRHDIVSYPITFWHPGLDKSGQPSTDDAIAQSRLKPNLKKIPIISQIVRGALHLVREVRHLRKSLNVLRSLDSLVIAGGGQLAELWRGPWSHPYNVFKFSLLTKLANKKLIFLNVGAGPLNSRLSKFFAKCSIYLADYVSFRDVESQALIMRLGVKCTTHVFPDSAYALDISNYESINAIKISKPVVGINPIGFCDPRTWPKQDKSAYLRYMDSLTEFSAWLVSQNYRLRIFTGELSVDVYAVEDLKLRLADCLPSCDIDDISVPPSGSVRDLLTEMSKFDFVVTSKFHGVVFSHLLARPVVALSYHNKINDLMKAVGHSQHCLNIETFDTKCLKEAFISLTANTESLQALFRQRARANSSLLNAQFDDLFASGILDHYSDVVTARQTGGIVRNST